MKIVDLCFLAAGLAMDCLAISIANGLFLRRFYWRYILLMSGLFGLFQGGMLLLGWGAASYFSHLIEAVDHWIAFGVLNVLGIRMIYQSVYAKEEKVVNRAISFPILLSMALATSIDALAVGCTFGFLGIQHSEQMLRPVLIVSVVALLFSFFGALFGVVSHHSYAKRIKVELWGGIILCLIGLKILIEHLYMHPHP